MIKETRQSLRRHHSQQSTIFNTHPQARQTRGGNRNTNSGLTDKQDRAWEFCDFFRADIGTPKSQRLCFASISKRRVSDRPWRRALGEMTSPNQTWVCISQDLRQRI